MKNSISIILVIMLLFISCSTNVEQKQAVSKKIMIFKKLLKKKINIDTCRNNTINNSLKTDISLLEIQDKIVWTDSGSFYLLILEPGKVHYIFGPTCDYWFPSEIIDNKIIFYWALNEDCVYDVGIKSKFSDVNNPELGQPFGKISLISDTTLFVKYYYEEWIKKINKQEYENIDTMFPSFFYRIDSFYNY